MMPLMPADAFRRYFRQAAMLMLITPLIRCRFLHYFRHCRRHYAFRRFRRFSPLFFSLIAITLLLLLHYLLRYYCWLFTSRFLSLLLYFVIDAAILADAAMIFLHYVA